LKDFVFPHLQRNAPSNPNIGTTHHTHWRLYIITTQMNVPGMSDGRQQVLWTTDIYWKG